MNDDEPDDTVAETDANFPGRPDGCIVRKPLPPRRRRMLTPDEIAARYRATGRRLPGEDPDWILQATEEARELATLTAYDITLSPRTPEVHAACRRFLAAPSRGTLDDLVESFGGYIDEEDLELLQAAADILFIAETERDAVRQATSITVVTPMVDPYCHQIDGFRCPGRVKVRAEVICRVCGPVLILLCRHHFNDLLKFLPRSEAHCGNASPGYHQIVHLVEAHASR